MLTDSTRLAPKDRAIADLAIKTMNECRRDYAPVYAMFPPNVYSMIQGAERKQDDLVAQLYNAKITFGDFNVGMNEIAGTLALAFSGIPSKPIPSATSQPVVQKIAEPKTPPPAATPVAVFHDKRLALVIGNGDYIDLPKLRNPINDARSIADTLQKPRLQD